MRLSRRRLLAATATASAGLAGCLGGGFDTQTATGTATGTATATSVPPALSVTDQETDGRAVTIPAATLDGDGWLVVHPKAKGGGPNGKVTLATKQLSAGTYSDVQLKLDAVRTGDQTVFGMLHYEDPADGEFTFPGDGDPPVTKDGSPLVEPFTVTLTTTPTPALSVTDQESAGESVTIPTAALDRDGWLVVHPEADGGGPDGSVTLATRQLPAGLYADVTLQLDETMMDSQTVYGMLHYEDPADGEFTFPGDGDPPVTKDGNPLVKPFEVTVSG